MFIIVYTCKNNTTYNLSNSIYDIYYNNLIINDYDIQKALLANENEENEKAVKQFIDSIMKEEMEKLKQRGRDKSLNSPTHKHKIK